MLRVPAETRLTTQVVDPELSVGVPPVQVRVVAPSLKVTVPPGVPPPGADADTVAVKVTDCPTTDGFVDDVTDVVVAAAFTTCDTAAEDDPAYGAEPAYAAVIDLVPADAGATVHVAVPALSVWEPPAHVRADPPSRKVTDPVGVPETALTVAVYVTGCPTTDGLADERTDVLVATDAWTVTEALEGLVAVHPDRTATTV